MTSATYALIIPNMDLQYYTCVWIVKAELIIKQLLVTITSITITAHPYNHSFSQ